MDLSTKIAVGSLLVSLIALYFSYQANTNYALVEKLDVDPQLVYFGNLCKSNCKPTFIIKNIGKVPAKQIKVYFNPAVLPAGTPGPLGNLFKFTLSNWIQNIPTIDPGQSVTINLPSDFINEILDTGRKFGFTFSNGQKVDTSKVSSDRFLIEIQIKFTREADLKSYTDSLYYLQNLTGDKWVSLEQATTTASYDAAKAAVAKLGLIDTSVIESLGSDRVYH